MQAVIDRSLTALRMISAYAKPSKCVAKVDELDVLP